MEVDDEKKLDYVKDSSDKKNLWYNEKEKLNYTICKSGK
jgi:hypothetical protein